MRNSKEGNVSERSAERKTLTREYFGKTIVSTQADAGENDGWCHNVDGHQFDTLAEAIGYARNTQQKAE